MPKFDFNNSRMAKFFSSEINRNYLQQFINREGILRANYTWYLTQGRISPDVTPTDNKGLAVFSVKSRELKAATLMNLRAPLGEGYQKEKGEMKWFTGAIPDFAADGFRETATERWYRELMINDEFGGDADLVNEYTNKLQDLVDSLDSTMTFMTARLASTGKLDFTGIARGIQAPILDANIPKENFKKAGALAWADENCDLIEQMRKFEEAWRKKYIQYSKVPLLWQMTKSDYNNVFLKNKQVAELWASWAKANFIATLQNLSVNTEMFLKSVTDINGLSPIVIVDEQEQNIRFDGTVETIQGWANGTVVLRPAGDAFMFMRKQITDKVIFEKLGNKMVDVVWASTNRGLGLLRNVTTPNGMYKEFKTDLFLASVPAMLDFPYRWIIDITQKG